MSLLMKKPPAIARSLTQRFRFIRWKIPQPITGTDIYILEIALYNAQNVEYPSVGMTADNAPVPLVASASSFYIGYAAFQAFNKNWAYGGGNAWVTASGVNSWIQLDLGSIDYEPSGGSCKLKILNTGQAPKRITIVASNTGAFTGEEVTLFSSGDLVWVNQETKIFYFP